MTKDYMVYKFQNNSNPEDILTEFFLPDNSLVRCLERMARVKELKTCGYKVLAVAYVDEETYINERLNVRVSDYCYADQLEQEYRQQFRTGQITDEVFFNTMRLIQDNKWTALKCMDMLVRRLCRKDYDVYNEIAIQLVDQYRQALI